MHKIFLMLVATIAQPAFAHSGGHHGNILASLWHLLTQPDHLALSAIVLIIGISSIALARRRALKTAQETRHDSR